MAVSDDNKSKGLDISLILPCRDEASTVGKCVQVAFEYLASSGLNGEILVIDNGSRDGTASIASAKGARVIQEPRLGYGNAIRKGLAESRGRVIIIGDADMTYDFSRLDDIYIPLVKEQYDMIIGDRFAGGIEPGAMPKFHSWGVKILSALGRMRFHTAVRDFHCGLRGLSANAAALLCLNCEGMEFATEMIGKAVHAKLRIGQVPVPLRCSIKERQSKLRTIPDGFRHLFLILFWNSGK